MPGSMSFTDDTDSLDTIDVKALAAEIGSELSPPEDSDTVIQEPVTPPKAESTLPEVPPVQKTGEATPPPGAIVPGQNSVAKTLPKSWKKEMAPLWEKADPALHEYVYSREADVMRGIQQYQQGYQQWDTLVKPYQSILQQYPDVNPVELMQGLMNTHLQLANPAGNAQEKVKIAQQLLQHYGISLDGAQTPPADAMLRQELAVLKNELTQLKSGFTRNEQAAYQAGVKEHEARINAFASDPKNEYFNEVGNDILRLIQTGVATDLASAYEMACWTNPVVRQKLLAKQQTQNTPAAPRDKSGKFLNLESDGSVPPKGKKASPSIDATVDSIVASHYSKH